MARIVFTPVGSLGDLHPAIAVAVELLRRGHAPVVATHPGHRARVEAAGVGFAPVRPDVGGDAPLAAVMARAMDERRGSEVVVREFVLPHLDDSYTDLLAACAGADGIVSHMLSFAAPIVAERLGIPWWSQVLQPQVLFSAHDPGVMQALPAPHWFARRGPLTWRLLWALGRRASRGWFRPVDRLRVRAGLPATGAHPLFDGFAPELNLASFPSVLAAPQPDWPPNTVVTGACTYDRDERGRAMPPALEAFLAEGPAHLVFTLGSSGVWDPGPFWRAAASVATVLKLRAVLLVGPEPREVPSPLPPGVLAVDYAAHGALFPHALVNVHHGGIGTTAQALAAGRPMVIVPYSHDHPDNAYRCRRLGVSTVVPRRRVSPYTLLAAVREAVGDPAIAARAAEAGARTRADDGAAAAADAIERALAARVVLG